jgi:dehydro coenzyme F420 reductase / coenzyme F420-0:L-glutamate ligase / coenzyme F420-1:gamma-L-glutamate ligase
MTADLHVLPVLGIPEVHEGDDLAALIAGSFTDIRGGDVVVVTQKAVSKAEGRVVTGPKEAWVERESRRMVARRGDLVIVETTHGFVCANAGIDESNVEPGSLSLLPQDPDRSAGRIREGLRDRTGADVAVVVSDTFGRPWRHGVVNVAIGCAGLAPLVDLRGTPDMHGRPLEVTVVAVADEVAAAGGLVMGKSEGVPVAVVRGAPGTRAEGTARDLVRPPEEDLFRYAPLEAIGSLRTVREFRDSRVPREVLVEAVRAALSAPVPHGSEHPSSPWMWSVLESRAARSRLLDAVTEAGARDPRHDGSGERFSEPRLERAREVLARAPVLAVPHMSHEEGRTDADRDLFLLAAGAAVQSFRVAVHAQGFASAWLSPNLFDTDRIRDALGPDPRWEAAGVVAVGAPSEEEPPPGRRPDIGGHLRFS